MKITIHHDLIVRIPQFPITAILEEEWDKLKESIHISSQDFHKTIEHLTCEDLKTIHPAIFHSIWKYFNRAKFRATPYGSFAGFGFIKNYKNNQTHPIIINDKQILHKFISWESISDINQEDELINAETLVFTNSTFYKVHDSIRYLSFDNGKFQLSEVEFSPLLHELLLACHSPISQNELRRNPKLNSGHFELLNEMKKAQLLLTDDHPNIIGDDFFLRQGLQSVAKSKYVIAERSIINGTPNDQIFKHIPNAVKGLAMIADQSEKNELNQFIKQFQRKFEQRLIPIMIALDPELGIAYGDFTERISDNDLISKFSNRRNENNSINEKETLKDFVLTNLRQHSSAPVHLENFTNQNQLSEPTLANSISVLCSVVDDKLIIDHLGGPTATALAGRFSIASAKVEGFCKDIAAIEQDANPGVLFFDIAYTAEINVDNINRRQRIYPYQVSILNFDTSEDPLTLDDICLGVFNAELILYSKRLKKRLVPRLASAYNYTRSNLPLFRLLCDLQGQGIINNLFINPQALVPNLNFYPRVQYHNIILSAAKWKVSNADFQEDSKSMPGTGKLKDYLTRLGLPDNILARTGDRTLTFNINEAKDLYALLITIKKTKVMYLEEALIPNQSIVRDEKFRPYSNQFLLALTHKSEIYKEVNFNVNPEAPEPVGHIFVPGSEWLYYEIYTHQMRSDELLLGKLHGFIKRQSKNILCWFFIRYNEGGDHIRFRLRAKQMHVPTLIKAVSVLLKDDLESGVISDFQLKTYKREISRYGISRIEKVEDHFNIDSNYVVQLIKNGFSIEVKYRLCIELLLRLRDIKLFTSADFEQLITSTTTSFLKEHQIIVQDYKTLNIEFKKFKEGMSVRFPKSIELPLFAFENSLISTLIDCPSNKRAQLFSDLIHMHINRLFASDQRTHEMIIYYFLSKELLYLRSKAA